MTHLAELAGHMLILMLISSAFALILYGTCRWLRARGYGPTLDTLSESGCPSGKIVCVVSACCVPYEYCGHFTVCHFLDLGASGKPSTCSLSGCKESPIPTSDGLGFGNERK